MWKKMHTHTRTQDYPKIHMHTLVYKHTHTSGQKSLLLTLFVKLHTQ